MSIPPSLFFFTQNVQTAEGRRTKRRKWKCKLKRENGQEIVDCFVISLNLQAKNIKCAPPQTLGKSPLPLLSQCPVPSEKPRSCGETPEEKGTVVWLLGKSIPK